MTTLTGLIQSCHWLNGIHRRPTVENTALSLFTTDSEAFPADEGTNHAACIERHASQRSAGRHTLGTLSAQTTGKPDDCVSGRPSTASRELRDILHERDDLRRDLEALRHNIEQVRLRLAKQDQLSEVQQDLDLTLSQLGRTESDEDESRSRILEAKVEKIEQKLDHLQERVDFDSELIELGFRLVDAVQNDEKREAKEPTQEISEVLDEMKNGC